MKQIDQKSLGRFSTLLDVWLGDGSALFDDEQGDANNCFITPLALRGVTGVGVCSV